jgi:hypothetical protein
LDRQSVTAFYDELAKIAQFGGDIDDLYATPFEAIAPYLRQAHKLRKSSSWMDIGPAGQTEGREIPYPRVPWEKRSGFLAPKGKEKTAEPPPPKGVSVKEWDKILQDTGEVYYHGTRPSLIPKIMKEGLRTEMMGTGFEGKPEGRPRVSLTKNPEHAQAYMRLGAQRDAAGAIAKLKAMIGRGVPPPLEIRFPKGKEPKEVIPAKGHGGMDEYHAYERVRPEWIRDRLREGGSQKLAYKLQGHTDFQGLRVAIENRKGSVRKGTDSDGNEWQTKMKYPYGYLVGTRAKDDEPVDVYVGPHEDAPEAFVVHQHKDDGTGFDEDKVMLGFQNKKEAKEAYLKHYDDPKFLGPISRVSIERLRELVRSKKKLVKIT